MNLVWKSSIRDFCFRSSSGHHATSFSTKEVSFFVFELFLQKYMYSASKDYFGPCGRIFLLLLLQAIVITLGIALIIAKAKSVIVFAIILFSWGIEGDS